MKIKFNGMKTSKSGGCKPCGAKRGGKSKYVTTRTFILPSGKHQTFRAGQVVEVLSQDADYLLKHGTVNIGNETKPVFEVVE